MSKPFYAQQKRKGKPSTASTSMLEPFPVTTPTLPIQPSACDLVGYIRFVLKSGAALELGADSVEEVTGTWADKSCHAVTGIKEDGTKAAIPVENIDYMEQAC